MNRLKGKTVIVTGAGSGIGHAIAKALYNEGANVVINDKNATLVGEFAKNSSIKGLVGDMSKMSDIKALVDFALEQFGSIDLLVANAGITYFATFLEIEEEEFNNIINLNLKGTFFLTQLVAKEMKDHGGRIILMSSNLSKRAYPNLAAYSMTKSAINMMARSLSLELAPYSILVNALAPGPTATDRTMKEVSDYRKMWSKTLPTGKPVEVTDIAKTALFLLRDANQINGQTVFVDGGWTGVGVNPN